jgi:hypothetical protein
MLRNTLAKSLFVIGQTGEQLIVRNDTKFKPQIW